MKGCTVISIATFRSVYIRSSDISMVRSYLEVKEHLCLTSNLGGLSCLKKRYVGCSARLSWLHHSTGKAEIQDGASLAKNLETVGAGICFNIGLAKNRNETENNKM